MPEGDVPPVTGGDWTNVPVGVTVVDVPVGVPPANGPVGAPLVVEVGDGTAKAASVGGGGGADPCANCQVQDAVPRDPAGCMKPMLPFTPGVLEPLIVVLVGATSIVGNVHSKASDEICPGGCGFPSIVCC
jgi:hypothetical protein